MATRQNSTNGKPKSPRIQVVLPELICEQLTILATNESRTVSNMAKVLIQEGIKKYFEQENRETVKKVIEVFHGPDVKWEDYVDLGYKRKGQDVRYALNDDKLRSLGWAPQKIFNEEIEKVVQFYIDNFKW